MTQLLLALWASLMFVELTRDLIIMEASAQNLSCFQCFKVSHFNQCKPKKCQANENVCLSNEVLLYSTTRSRVQISKRCAVGCSNSNSLYEWPVNNIFHAKIIRQCCSATLCNRAPDNRDLPEKLLPPMALSLLCTLLSTPVL